MVDRLKLMFSRWKGNRRNRSHFLIILVSSWRAPCALLLIDPGPIMGEDGDKCRRSWRLAGHGKKCHVIRESEASHLRSPIEGVEECKCPLSFCSMGVRHILSEGVSHLRPQEHNYLNSG